VAMQHSGAEAHSGGTAVRAMQRGDAGRRLMAAREKLEHGGTMKSAGQARDARRWWIRSMACGLYGGPPRDRKGNRDKRLNPACFLLTGRSGGSDWMLPPSV